jgi:hypothetical protein
MLGSEPEPQHYLLRLVIINNLVCRGFTFIFCQAYSDTADQLLSANSIILIKTDWPATFKTG